MSHENPWWGAPRIHGELLMLGTEVAQSTIAKYLDRRGRPSSQGWKTFLRNHAAGIASIDLFVVRSISFKLLYGLVILGHLRRRNKQQLPFVSRAIPNGSGTQSVSCRAQDSPTQPSHASTFKLRRGGVTHVADLLQGLMFRLRHRPCMTFTHQCFTV